MNVSRNVFANLTFFLLFGVLFQRYSATVFILGGAGFLGYHTSLQLSSLNIDVVVLDDIENETEGASQLDEFAYWRRMRADKLLMKGIKVYHGDLCDVDLLKYLINSLGDLSGIAYFRGDEGRGGGVAYVEERMQCFVSLLEILREFNKGIPVVYMSSSAVSNKKKAVTDSGIEMSIPSTMFSAVKSSEESFAELYCHLYGVQTIGVRSFYPYGPFADPDSLIYNMAKAIERGGVITVPYKDGVPLSYDLTHVTDIALGICKALKRPQNTCGLTYELGTGKTVPVTVVIDSLEKKLKRKAIHKPGKVVFSTPPPEANTSLARMNLGYTPTLTFEEGIDSFMDWFIKEKRHNTHKKGQLNFIINRALSADIKTERLRKRGWEFFKRHQKIREGYEKNASTPVAKLYKDRKFIFFPNVDVKSGLNDRVLKGLTIEGLRKRCLIIDECIAFTTKGVLKTYIGPQENWTHLEGNVNSCDGMYVADIDACEAGIHNCFGNATCKYLGPSQFICECAKGWSMKDGICIQTDYVEGITSEMEVEKMYYDKLKGHFWTGKVTDSFTEKKGYSINGSAILSYHSANGDINKLKDACLHTYHCIGFNSNDNQLRTDIDHLDTHQTESMVAYIRNIKRLP